MPTCRRLFWHDERRAASRTDWTAGSSRPTSVPMIAITIRSSMSVKPRATLPTDLSMALASSRSGTGYRWCLTGKVSRLVRRTIVQMGGVGQPARMVAPPRRHGHDPSGGFDRDVDGGKGGLPHRHRKVCGGPRAAFCKSRCILRWWRRGGAGAARRAVGESGRIVAAARIVGVWHARCTFANQPGCGHFIHTHRGPVRRLRR